MKALEAGMKVAGRFILVRRLGAGGLAEVWVARDETTGAEVALKLLHAHLSSDKALVDRFKRELAVTRELQHPGIVRVFDLHEHDGRPLFSMELLEGETLADRLKAGPLAQEEAKRIAREVAVALASAHKAGVVHRDLKPANIIITKDGRVKLLDFGLARAAGWSRLTAQSTVMGTPGYIAPEMLTGKGTDARADLYSLGATLFEMLTGKRAFPGTAAFSTLRLKEEAPPSARKLVPQIEPELDAVVQRALEGDVEKRFLDAAQMIRALDSEAPPPAPEIPMALTAGDWDVVVRQGLNRLLPGGNQAISRVYARLGAPTPGFAWATGRRITGRALLVAGTTRAQAERVVALCQSEGLTAQIAPSKTPGPAARWLANSANKGSALAAVAACVAFALLDGRYLYFDPVWTAGSFGVALLLSYAAERAGRAAPLSAHAPPAIDQSPRWRDALRRMAIGGVAGFALMATVMIIWLTLDVHQSAWKYGLPRPGDTAKYLAQRALTFASGATWPHALRTAWGYFLHEVVGAEFTGFLGLAIGLFWRKPRAWQKRLERGDPAVRRLLDGITLRFKLLRARTAKASPASQMLLDEMLVAAGETEREARKLADQAAEIVDESDPAQAGDVRDRAIDRLLEIAAALDDALARIDGQHPRAAQSLALGPVALEPPPKPIQLDTFLAGPPPLKEAAEDADEEPTLPPGQAGRKVRSQ